MITVQPSAPWGDSDGGVGQSRYILGEASRSKLPISVRQRGGWSVRDTTQKINVTSPFCFALASFLLVIAEPGDYSTRCKRAHGDKALVIPSQIESVHPPQHFGSLVFSYLCLAGFQVMNRATMVSSDSAPKSELSVLSELLGLRFPTSFLVALTPRPTLEDEGMSFGY